MRNLKTIENRVLAVLREHPEARNDDMKLYLLDVYKRQGMITFNALTAADSVIIPVQAQYLPAKGMTQLLGTIAKAVSYTHLDVYKRQEGAC